MKEGKETVKKKLQKILCAKRDSVKSNCKKMLQKEIMKEETARL
jgi:septum formation topological specificity factor MinE